MYADIVITARDAREIIAQDGDPHMIWDGASVQVIPEWWWREHHREAGWALIMTKADLLATDPDAAGYDPARLASMLTGYARDIDLA